MEIKMEHVLKTKIKTGTIAKKSLFPLWINFHKMPGCVKLILKRKNMVQFHY